MTPELRLERRVRYLPEAYQRAQAKLERVDAQALLRRKMILAKIRQLEEEAASIGLPDRILRDPKAIMTAWDREVEKAKLEAALDGRESSISEGQAL